MSAEMAADGWELPGDPADVLAVDEDDRNLTGGETTPPRRGGSSTGLVGSAP